jgi:hypothetical protein
VPPVRKTRLAIRPDQVPQPFNGVIYSLLLGSVLGACGDGLENSNNSNTTTNRGAWKVADERGGTLLDQPQSDGSYQVAHCSTNPQSDGSS